MNPEIRQAVIELVKENTGVDLDGCEVRSVAGGCINEAFCLLKGGDDSARVFVKVNQASALLMFEAESAGLSEIAQSETIRVPEPIGIGTVGNDSFFW